MSETRNELFPVFLKLDEIETLVVGGGNVGLEKISALLKSCPSAKVTIVSKAFHDDLLSLVEQHPSLTCIARPFETRDLANKHIVILTTDDHELHRQIQVKAREMRLLINAADTPKLCDFYLGAVVTKGNLKIGISTNGKSPTMAKRIREFFEEVIPDDLDHLFENLQSIRNQIKGDFKAKVDLLNEVTSGWLKRT